MELASPNLYLLEMSGETQVRYSIIVRTEPWELTRSPLRYFSLNETTPFSTTMSAPSEKPSSTDESTVRLLVQNEDTSYTQASPPPYRLEVLDKKRSRLAWAGAVTAASVVILTGGIATAFIGWILFRRFPPEDAFEPGLLVRLPRASFVVSEGEKFENDGSSDTTASLRALTISALAVSPLLHHALCISNGCASYRVKSWRLRTHL